MRNAELHRIRGGKALRDPTVKGRYAEDPVPGQPFVFVAPARDEGLFRLITTSMVVNVLYINESETIFETESGSIYELSRTERK